MSHDFINQLNQLLFMVVALFSAITVHEYAHARMALLFGDGTAKLSGRLTLNPLKHMDWIGALMLIIFRFGWAKPVPINPRNFRNYRQGMIWVSLAGPLANVALAFLVALFLRVVLIFPLPGFINFMLIPLGQMLIIYNVYFAIFNLFPFPPLDGSKILTTLLPPRYVYKYGSYLTFLEQYGFWILLLLAYTGVIWMIMSPFVSSILYLIRLIIPII